ncbi:TPA: hypothetical protein ACGTY6_005813, partial [Klebsiella pneumoniae]
MQKILRVIAVSAVFWVRSVSADPGCQNAEVIGGKLITDICWSCIFPIKVAGCCGQVFLDTPIRW